ncbi:MAG: UDP-2,3-diacylglucosamine diphosphatase [Gammaproteobacteria bacterium]|nr:MAG: UDP-2,3-diacylglucosamine diphosphatase [Gammaproteobacteria bacterium]
MPAGIEEPHGDHREDRKDDAEDMPHEAMVPALPRYNDAMPEKIFISDLHLAEERPQTLALFEHFLRQRPHPGDQLYILGDLFDAWVGDDDDAPLAVRVRTSLRGVSRRGISLYLQRGNRDFLMGRRLMKAIGATLLPDPFKLEVAGEPTLLMHGDLLCTDDIAYQKARRRLRNPLFQWLALRRSLAARRKMAADYRRRSGEKTAMTPAEIMDANPETVRRYLERHGATQLIHGHTHRPAVHEHPLADGTQARRYVLDEWHADHAACWVDDGKALRRETITPGSDNPRLE